MKPQAPIRHLATRIHGITDQHVCNRPAFETVRADVIAALGRPAIVAHNAHVDLDVLRRELPGRQPPEVFDTLKLARRLVPGLESYRLGSLVATFDLAKGLPSDLSPHRATYDALVTARLFAVLATRARSLEELRGQIPEGPDAPAALF